MNATCVIPRTDLLPRLHAWGLPVAPGHPDSAVTWAAEPQAAESNPAPQIYGKQTLRCGKQAVVREAQADDVVQTPGFLRALTLSSQRRRFHGRLPALGAAALHSAQPLADPKQGVLVAVLKAGCQEHLLADARFVCDAGGREAEFALIVADALHRQGLGRALLLALQQLAAERGVRWLRGEVQVDNPAMLCLLLSLGFKPALRDEAAGLLVFEQRLQAWTS